RTARRPAGRRCARASRARVAGGFFVPPPIDEIAAGEELAGTHPRVASAGRPRRLADKRRHRGPPARHLARTCGPRGRTAPFRPPARERRARTGFGGDRHAHSRRHGLRIARHRNDAARGFAKPLTLRRGCCDDVTVSTSVRRIRTDAYELLETHRPVKTF